MEVVCDLENVSNGERYLLFVFMCSVERLFFDFFCILSFVWYVFICFWYVYCCRRCVFLGIVFYYIVFCYLCDVIRVFRG